MKVAIIGAGITGITTAYYASKAGHNVTVFEEERYAGMKTSFANGGQISVSNSETWTTPSNVKKAIKWMFTKDAPLLVRPRLDFAMWRWVFKFLKYSFDGSYTDNTSWTVKMGLKSRQLYDKICAEEHIEFDRKNSGIIHFYKTPAYWENAQSISDLYALNGLVREKIEPNKLNKIDPALKDISNVIGATATHSDWTGDIHKFTYNLAEILSTKYNVKFNYNTKITNINRQLSEFDTIIVCNGVGSVEVAQSIGETIDVYPVKGYSITINNVDPKYLPKVSLLDDEAKIVTSTLGNKFRVAGTAELTGENYDIRRDRIEPLLKWVHTNFPNINTHDYTQWACLRPMTPNMMPILRQSTKNSKVYYNTGHGHLGWTLGPFTAQKICEIAGLL